MSGGSLSRFSSRYLTSDINKQPALLNSIIRHQLWEAGELEKTIPVPSFKAEASSSSACCRFRKRDMGVRDRSEFPQNLDAGLTFSNHMHSVRERKTDRIHKNQVVHGEEKKETDENRSSQTRKHVERHNRRRLSCGRETTSTTLAKQQ